MSTLSAASESSHDRFRRLVDSTVDHYRKRYRVAPTWVVAAPGRVNLIGEHIDYNDGFVLPMAIERYVVLAAAPAQGPASTFYSVDLNQAFEVNVDQQIEPTDVEWSNYIRGVLSGWKQSQRPCPPVNVVVQSNVPIGGGLSSSAALEVATATLLESVTQQDIDPIEKALLCQQAEHEFAGVPCGIMDQFSSVMCGENALMLLDCRDRTSQSVPLVDDNVSVLVTNSNVKHELTGGEYAQRRAQCESALAKIGIDSWRDVTLETITSCSDQLTEIEQRRAHHIVTETDRTWNAAQAARDSDWDRLGHLMNGSHQSLRDDFEVSCNEVDMLVDIAVQLGPEHGVLGSRMTGGGFGGCTVTLIRTDQAAATSQRINDLYLKQSGIEPASFVTRPARGAHRIEFESTPQEKPECV
tara:strand:- start:282678 stop:283913 length:1236 start_codon:yes stop_codon:yes gene_type:complete